MSEEAMPEGTDFFKALANAALFRMMELPAEGATDERMDAQMDLARCLQAAAKVSERIDALDAAALK